MKCVVPKSINTEAHIGWCPGCGHGIVCRILYLMNKKEKNLNAA